MRNLFMQAVAMAAAALGAAVATAAAQDSQTADEISQGHHLAVEVCAICHVAATDQRGQPILHPPAPPFASIMQRKDVSAEWLTNFLKTTHRGLDAPSGMPNPDLADFQIKQVVAYMMSLRKP